MPASDADIKFLQLSSTLSMYGTHYYPAFEWIFAGKYCRVVTIANLCHWLTAAILQFLPIAIAQSQNHPRFWELRKFFELKTTLQ